ncbi:cytochrome P450 [Aspergillus undulatus]|uniref:cytochrome P450 n=1 Tax=Aspergillus undulatus TaxID=1810928 RepID=UPI003CCDFF54
MFYRDRKADECNHICQDFVQQFVDSALHAAEVKKECNEQQAETKRHKRIFSRGLAWRTADRRRVQDELMNILVAGRDTTASLLGKLFFMLARDPTIWNKLCDEVSNLEDRAPTYEELRSLEYVQCCLNDSLRSRSNGPGVPIFGEPGFGAIGGIAGSDIVFSEWDEGLPYSCYVDYSSYLGHHGYIFETTVMEMMLRDYV